MSVVPRKWYNRALCGWLNLAQPLETMPVAVVPAPDNEGIVRFE